MKNRLLIGFIILTAVSGALVVYEAGKRLDFALFTFGIPLIPHICVLASFKLTSSVRRIYWIGPLLVSILLYGNFVLYTELLEVRAQDVLIFPYVAFWQFLSILIVVVFTIIINIFIVLRHNKTLQGTSRQHGFPKS